MTEILHVLLVEDNPADVDLIREMLPEKGPIVFEVTPVPRLSEAIARLATGGFDLALIDLGLPDSQGLGTFRKLRQVAPDLAMVVLTGNDDQETAVAAVREGAQDYLVKGQVIGNLLVRATRYAIERKRAEQSLLESDQHARFLTDILERSAQPFAVAYPDGRLGIHNKGFCELTGYESDEFPAIGWSRMLTPPEWDEADARALRELDQTDHPVRFEKEYIRKDGTRVPIELFLHATKGPEGDILYYHAFVTDITERKRSEEQLRKLSTAVTQSPTSVMITNLKGNIEYVNPRFTEVTGYTLAEVQGRNPRILKSGETPPEEYRNLWTTITGGGEWRGEFHNRKKDGSLFWELAFISPVRDASGVITHFLGIKEDITQRKDLEEQYRQAQKMEAIGQLAGGVAHDFNNILQAMVGYSSLLLDRLPEHDETHGYAEEIAQSADRAAILTRQLLTFSRRQILEMEDLDLNDVVQALIKMIARIIGEDIAIEVLQGRRLGLVHADRGQIEQVLLNLCVNARDAMPAGGSVTIETENLAMDKAYCDAHAWASPGRYVLLSVTDSGCGMDAETQARIFEPFFTTKEVGKGTGLGLATVYGIVRQHQGMIQVYSEMGKGTTFKVYLPSIERTASTVGTKIVERAIGGTETILVAEDDEMLRKLAARILETVGYTVLLAADGQEALDMFEKQAANVDLLLLDVVMPRMGGKAVYNLLHPRHPRLRFLFSSGYSSNAIHTGFVLQEGIELIQKPYAPDALLRKVRQVLDAAGPITAPDQG
jgi:PAS domain S-box-containing protein